MDGNCHLHIDANCEYERHSPGKNIFPHAYEDKWVYCIKRKPIIQIDVYLVKEINDIKSNVA